jgi:hypothetical protein
MSIEDVFKINLMILEVISEHPKTQLAGMVAIADFTGFNWLKHYQYLSPYYAKKSAEVVQVINISYYITIIIFYITFSSDIVL